jgi:outer membrane protein assembly factor BamB
MTRPTGPRVLATLLAASALATAGCWPQPGGNPANSNWNAIESELTIDTVATLAPVWTAEGDLDAVFGRHVLGMSAGGDSFSPGAGFVNVTSLDAGTGAQNWSTDIAPGFIAEGLVTGSAVVVGDQVWAEWLAFAIGPRGGQGCLGGGSRLDLETGASVGSTNLLADIMTTGDLTAVEETTFLQDCTFGASSGLRVLSGGTAELVWENTALGSTQPVAADGRMIDTLGTTVRSFAAAGCGAPQCQPVWTADLGVPLGGLVADGDRLYTVGGTDPSRELLGLDIATGGAIVWRAPLASLSGMAAFGGILYVSGGTTLSAYDGAGCVSTCSPLWTATLPGQVFSNLAGAGGVVYAASEDGTVSAFDAAGCGAATCVPVKQVSLGGRPTGRLIVASGHLYAGVAAETEPFSRVVAFAPT